MAKRLPCCADVKGKASNASLYFDIPNPISQSHYLSFPRDPNIKTNEAAGYLKGIGPTFRSNPASERDALFISSYHGRSKVDCHTPMLFGKNRFKECRE